MGLNKLNLSEEQAKDLNIGSKLDVVNENDTVIKTLEIDKIDASGRGHRVRIEADEVEK